MRSEFKIGIVVGLVVIAGGIIFFVNQGKKAGGTASELPMNAPAQRAAPGAAKPEATPSKAAEKRPIAPPRTTPTERPAAAEQRPVITPPPARPAGATPRPGETAAGPVVSPLTPRTTPTPKPAGEAPAATQPRPTPELPPLAGATESPRTATPGAVEPTTRPAAPSEPAETPLISRTPAVSVPPPKETERPAATPLPAPPREPGRKYTVAEGETLWSIAEEQYGDPYLWSKLLAANPGIKENVDAGQVINLPPKEALVAPAKDTKPGAKPATTPTETAAGAKPATEARAGTYVVEKGDTLYSIAAKVMGNGNRWRELLELNKDKLTKPEELKIGMELKVPVKGGAAGKSEPAKPEPKKNGAKKKS
jgi:nucleoid-associated protein YgaU